MRYSASARLAIKKVAGKSTNEQFLAQVARESTPEQRRCALLLVGGNDHRALAIRQAQAPLRLDRLPSYWSHAALILDWEAADVANAVGVEASLDPEDLSEQVPERNGVTFFRVSRYLDQNRYPNLCVVVPTEFERSDKDQTDVRRRLSEAALDPNRERVRYRLWDWLGVWARFIYAPVGTPNPVTEGIPLPAAALCEYAYEAGGLDLTPGATAPNACPELLWATILHWHDRMGGVKIRAWRLVRDPVQAPRAVHDAPLDEAFRAFRGEAPKP